MKKKIKLLDCTLRDGAYINGSHFGEAVLKGIIKKMQEARVDIIECGWLKDAPHEKGSSYYHLPTDVEPYMLEKNDRMTYVTMIDWDRYDTDLLPPYAGGTLNAVRVVFPRGKAKEGMAVGAKIREKGYLVFLQAANTISYTQKDLDELIEIANDFKPVAISVVDTFGAMFEADVIRIATYLNKKLDKSIGLGFHSHNNQQLSFALTMKFVELLKSSDREVIVDASLSGMGRGAGNATTELVASYLNRKHHGDYDMDAILDAIDMYIDPIRENFSWGYSTPYFIAGMYQCHVNNIAYLHKNHRTNARDMRNIFASLGEEERRHYDYVLLEEKYIENQNRLVDDEAPKRSLKEAVAGHDRKVLLIAPGKTSIDEERKIKDFIMREHPLVIGVNAVLTPYADVYDYLFFTNHIRYDYAGEAYHDIFQKTEKLILSSVHSKAKTGELVFNFNSAIKRGWEHFDNAVICALRLLDHGNVKEIFLAGFDGFKHAYNESYADASLPTLNPDSKWEELNHEIEDMFRDVTLAMGDKVKITFLTDSIFSKA